MLKHLKSLTVVGNQDSAKCERWQRFFDQSISGAHLKTLGLSGRGCQLSSISPTVEWIKIRTPLNNNISDEE